MKTTARILAKNAAYNGRECPECGERDRHHDNGHHGDARAYVCTACHAQWDADSFALTHDEERALFAAASR
jgi:DNA-directed RNA polymerase subunit RPC12/RpoP